jgi:hypothetical protein
LAESVRRVVTGYDRTGKSVFVIAEERPTDQIELS